MKTLRIGFDVDGTLRCNCSDICRDPNTGIVELFNTLSSFQNVELFVWSGGGAEYARGFAKLYRLKVNEDHCINKLGAPRMDIAIDDMPDTNLADINLIMGARL